MIVNKVIVLGRLGQDPDVRYTSSGISVCNFSLATSESWVDKSGQKQEKTEWHRIVVWGKLGEICHKYLSKGRQVFVEGALQTRSWDDKNGQKRYTTEINAKNVQFIGGQQTAQPRDQSQDNAQMNQAAPNNSGGGDVMNQEYNISTDANFTADDIPF